MMALGPAAGQARNQQEGWTNVCPVAAAMACIVCCALLRSVATPAPAPTARLSVGGLWGELRRETGDY